MGELNIRRENTDGYNERNIANYENEYNKKVVIKWFMSGLNRFS